MTKPITDRMLKKAGACSSQRRLFRKLFGAGALVTIGRAKRAHKAGLSLRWACGNLFSDNQRAAFNSDSWVKHCYDRYVVAPIFSQRETSWSEKLDLAKVEAFVRVWNTVE